MIDEHSSAEERTKYILLGNFIYTAHIINGNHGGWLFVKCDKQVIYEQPGYKDYNKAMDDGELIIYADYRNKMTPKRINPWSYWRSPNEQTTNPTAS